MSGPGDNNEPKGFWAKLQRRLGPGAAARDSWANSAAHREILSGLTLGETRTHELRSVWRVLLWAGLLLALFQVQAGLLTRMGPELVRVDLAVLFVTFFALRLGAIEGALAAYAAGYVADLFVQGPPGLCRFLAVAIWTGGRILGNRAGFSSPVGRVIFVLAASALYQAGTLGGLQLASVSGPGQIAWLSVVPQAFLAAALALPAHRLLGSLERRTSSKGR